MLSGKTVKFILYEVLQFAALTVPIFVIMERFARIIHTVQGGNRTAYWLVVAVSIAYVTTVGSSQIYVPEAAEVHLRHHTVVSTDVGKYNSVVSVTLMNCLHVKR